MCKEEMDKEESSGIERSKEMDMGGKLKEVTCNLIVEIWLACKKETEGGGG